MFSIIETIQRNAIYQLKGGGQYTQQDLIDYLKFIQTEVKDRSAINEDDVLNYLKKYNCIELILKLVPFPIIIKLYEKHKFLENYWNSKMIDTIIQQNRLNAKIDRLNLLNQTAHFIKLNGSLNRYYNFRQEIFSKRIKQLNLPFTTNDFYFGQNICLYIASFTGSPFYKQLIPFKIYSKKVHFKIGTLCNFTQTDSGQYFYAHQNFCFILDSHYYENSSDLFYSGKEDLIYDGIDILVNANGHLKLNQQYDSETITDATKPYEKNKLTFKKYCIKNSDHIPRCYICKNHYVSNVTLDRYGSLCLNCAYINYQNSLLKANLDKQTAFVTGIRQKIGLQIALKLLRNHATVIGTTRYPYATLYNYAKQPDYDEWKDRLVIISCDFTNLDQVKSLIDKLKTYSINILINNAAQTIRASPSYYQKLASLESSLAQHFLPFDNKSLILHQSSTHLMLLVASDNQLEAIQTLKTLKIELNRFDDIQDIDIKEQSSWMQKIEQIDLTEIFEVTAINQLVPTLLINQLKPFMTKPGFIINVTCLEGQFNCEKMSTHAHVNMCKSAMNMLIRTISEEKNSG